MVMGQEPGCGPKGLVEALMGKEVPSLGVGGGLGGSPRSVTL